MKQISTPPQDTPSRPALEVVRDQQVLRQTVSSWHTAGYRIGLVPTMGALHRGHLALVARARETCERVVVSIFVNPKQFGPQEDFAAYPRDEAGDVEKLRAAGADVVWMPSAATMYPPGFSTEVTVGELGDSLCGAFRPGHFAGVATVVAKLFLQTSADQAFFGEKDFQQLQIIRRLVRDLDMPVQIIGVETLREPDGLALSSRNIYLSEAERAIAAVLPDVLKTVAGAIAQKSGAIEAILSAGKCRLLEAGFASVDYLTVVDIGTLRSIDVVEGPARVLVAARLGRTRLIDNVPVTPWQDGDGISQSARTPDMVA